ncbi:MAG: hypothetical protein IJ036_02665 [Lachnospiraceae bacterium]|nr:hypothetical protein [Lachnospiraceae bacterium]
MSAAQRVRVCCLLQKMENDREYARRLGLENASTFHGKKALNTIGAGYIEREENYDYNYNTVD